MEENPSQPGPQTLTFANHPKNAPGPNFPQRPKPGPQLWAIVLAVTALYYLWTRILGRPLPAFFRTGSGGRRLGSKGPTDTEMATTREKRLARSTTARSSTATKEENARERPDASHRLPSASSSSSEQLKQQRLAQEKQRELEEKKRKQRQLYLRKKAELEKQEEERRKDEELGPGWRYRQDPSVVRNVVNGMDPQSGGEGGGGYKPQVCTRRGG